MMVNVLTRLRHGEPLSASETRDTLLRIMAGESTPAQTGAFLMALAQRGETAEEILGGAMALRAHMHAILSPFGTMDCCGTGGDHAGTYNISTAVAFVLAACGVPVAKHGNRAASSKSGAADVLEELGVNLDIAGDDLALALKTIGYCFLMAPHHHTVLRPLANLRKELGFRTLFNALGPLANPADTKHQLVGVYDRKLLHPMAEALRELGSNRAIIVHGEDGLDEVTLTAPTHYAFLHDGKIDAGVLTPDDFGLAPITPQSISGDDPATNARALTQLLNGAPSAYRDVVLANAATALWAAGHVPDLREGVARAAAAIDTGRALGVLTAYRDFTVQRKRA